MTAESSDDRTDIATATRWQIAAVAATLSEAFADDPFFVWLFPDRRERPRQIDEWWRYLLRRRPAGSKTWQAADVAAAALWHPPHEGAGAGDDAFAAWFVRVLGNDALVDERFEFFGQVLDAHLAEPHWYLASVGVRPEHQGKGLGTAILDAMLAECDRSNTPAYLESSNPRNVGLYERLGFVTTVELPLPDESSRLTMMYRRPR